MKQPKTQIAAVAYLFLKGEKLTTLNTFKLTGSQRLSAKLFELKKLGMKFKVKHNKFKTKFGTSGVYDSFELDKSTSKTVIKTVKERFKLI